MKKSHKYQRNARIRRNCEQCKYYGGMISKHYFVCLAEVYEMQERIAARDIYDIRVMKKGSCYLFNPKEVTNDLLCNYVTMDFDIEKDPENLPDEE